MFFEPVHTMLPDEKVSAVVLGFRIRIVMAANFGGLKSVKTSLCEICRRFKFFRPNEKVATQF